VPLPKLHPASDLGVRFSGGIVQIRYIKLGIGGIWEQSCIETDGTIRLGYQSLMINWTPSSDEYSGCFSSPNTPQ
jgi:hypothetical protein